MRRAALMLVLALAVLAAGAAAQASAHPLGNFTVNSYLRVEASGGELYLRQVVDMAEIPSFRERAAVDRAGGLPRYAARRAAERARDIAVTVDGRRLAAAPVSQAASLRPGQGGLQVLRYAAWYRVRGAGEVAPGPHRVEVAVPTYRGRVGWHELIVRGSSGARVDGSTAPADDLADELRAYPGDLLQDPPDVTRASFTWHPGEGLGAVGPTTLDPERPVRAPAPDGLAGLVDDDLSAGVVLVAVLLAMGWGALHSLSPGHGKTMVAAYLVGTRGTARHALILGVFVTLTHTAGVVALGLVTLFASRYVLPETLLPWITLVAALLVVGIGLRVAWSRWSAARRRRAHARLHHHGHAHDHSHGHSHEPPADLSTRSLVAVGASAGLIPCPSALVLLLGAIALDRIGYGLVLVLAFSIGLAGLLSLIGLLVLYARRLVERLPLDGRIAAAVPALSALVIVGLGIALIVQAVPAVV